MKVEDSMSTEVALCHPDDTLRDAASALSESGRGALVVVAADGSRRVVGVVTDRDVCLALGEHGAAAAERQVRAAMSSPVHCCRPGDGMWEVVELAETHGVRRFPVVDADRQLVGVVTLSDVARALDAQGPGSPIPSARRVTHAFARCGAARRGPSHSMLHG